jgi:asparaginyl-tRNA synthetase
VRRIKAPRTWTDNETHSKNALSSEWYKIISKLQAEIVRSSINFYNTKDCNYLLLPITTGSVSSPMGLGSDSLPVEVEMGGVKTYMADSMQFMLEYSARLLGENTYYISPSFRGEKADERHLCQFSHSEAEIIGNLDDVITFVEQYLRHIAKDVLDNLPDEIIKISGTTDHISAFLSKKSIPRCTLNEAMEILRYDDGFIDKGNSHFKTITSSGEKKLMDHFSGFVWLTEHDHLSVPFYQKFKDGDKSKALCADLLMGIGETVGAGERHESGAKVREALEMHEVNESTYSWYIDMKDQVILQTSGFGLGIERFMLWILNHNDIRDMQLVPRFNGEKYVF